MKAERREIKRRDHPELVEHEARHAALVCAQNRSRVERVRLMIEKNHEIVKRTEDLLKRLKDGNHEWR